jgi:hypothetical protein
LAIFDISGTGRIWESGNRGLAKTGIIKVARFFRFLVRFQPLFGNAFKEKIFAMKKKCVMKNFWGGVHFKIIFGKITGREMQSVLGGDGVMWGWWVLHG